MKSSGRLAHPLTQAKFADLFGPSRMTSMPCALAVSVVLGFVPTTSHLGQTSPRTVDESSSRTRIVVVLEGRVTEHDGAPAEGALVQSSAGASAQTDARGLFSLSLEVPLEAERVELTASSSRSGRGRLCRTVPCTKSSWVGVLQLQEVKSCSPGWIPTFGREPGMNDAVLALAVYDDGSGPALYAGGRFLTAGGEPANHVARWNGQSWTPLASGTNGLVTSMCVFDDGVGPELYVGGDFTTAGGVAAAHIAKWDGSSWSALGSGTDNPVLALAASGGGLYAGGSFMNAGGAAASRIARWSGSSWSALGSGLDGYVSSLLPTGGGGLYVGGSFLNAGGQPARNLARWDGASWSWVGPDFGSQGVNATVRSMAFYFGDLYVTAGTDAGGTPVVGLARWDGHEWSALSAELDSVNVSYLQVHDAGSGPELYVSGGFHAAGGVPAEFIASWNGSQWSARGDGLDCGAGPLASFDDGFGAKLVTVSTLGGVCGISGESYRVSEWDGALWTSLGDGLDASVSALLTHDIGNGEALYASGAFGRKGNVRADRVARWDGSTWAPLGAGLGFSAELSYYMGLVIHDDGSGPALFVGGDFTIAGGQPASHVAKWNGTTWMPLGLGVNYDVTALASYDDGSGPALYAGGYFTEAGGLPIPNVARWNGMEWAPVGIGLSATPLVLRTLDTGSGPILYAGGEFSGVMAWDGVVWSPVGSLNFGVLDLVVHDDGTGPALYASGVTGFGGNVARWDGATWWLLGASNGSIESLLSTNTGNAPTLFAGGRFSSIAGLAANHIARWDGQQWAALGGGIAQNTPSGVFALAAFDDGGGNALYAGGNFRRAIDSGDSYLARWDCEDTTPPYLSCPAGLEVIDKLGTPPGEIVTFAVVATDAGDPNPTIVCLPPSGSLFPRGTTIVTCTATDAAGNQSSCQFPVTVTEKKRKRSL